MKKNFLIVVTTWATLAIITTPVLAEGNIAAGKEKARACVACHGADGNSFVPQWPKLAEQSARYITRQLQSFKAGQRVDNSQEGKTMMGLVQPLSQQDIEDLAAYFSSQSIKRGSSTSDLLNVGKQVYRKGHIKARVLACVGCHGFKGAGNNALLEPLNAHSKVEAPRIGSQHATYIIKQLKAFRDETRNNDVGKIMRNIAKGMTDEEINAVAEYIATLH